MVIGKLVGHVLLAQRHYQPIIRQMTSSYVIKEVTTVGSFVVLFDF